MFSKVLLWLRSSLRLPNNWAPFLSKQDQEKILLLWAGVRKHISQQMAIWYKLAYAAQWMIVCDLLPCSRTRSLPRFQAIPETKKDERTEWNYIQLQTASLPFANLVTTTSTRPWLPDWHRLSRLGSTGAVFGGHVWQARLAATASHRQMLVIAFPFSWANCTREWSANRAQLCT